MEECNLDSVVSSMKNKILSEKEYMCAKFLEETGLKISECELCYKCEKQIYKIWIQKKQKGEFNAK